MGENYSHSQPRIDSTTATGPDLSKPENAELFVDWRSEAFLDRDYENIPDEEKSKISADEILAYYLAEVCRKVNPEYYLVILKFVVGFRECLNRYGWEKKAENDEILI